MTRAARVRPRVSVEEAAPHVRVGEVEGRIRVVHRLGVEVGQVEHRHRQAEGREGGGQEEDTEAARPHAASGGGRGLLEGWKVSERKRGGEM